MNVNVLPLIRIMDESFSGAEPEERMCVLMYYLYSGHLTTGIINSYHQDLITRMSAEDSNSYMIMCSRLAKLIAGELKENDSVEERDDSYWISYQVPWDGILEPFVRIAFSKTNDEDDLPW